MDHTLGRREYLLGVTVSSFLLAGCAGDDENTTDIQDSDGDGVIDSEDYAPRDPDVQERSDIEDRDTITATPNPTTTPTPTTTATSTPASTATPTPTPTATPTPTPTPTATPTPTPESNQLVVDDEYWQDTSRISWYSGDEVSVVVNPNYPETDSNRVKVYAGLLEFPNNGVIAETVSEEFDRGNRNQEITLSLNPGSVDTQSSYYYLVGFLPSDSTQEDIEYSSLSTIMESDPFQFESNGQMIYRTEYENELDDDSGTNYSRNNVEGAYELSVSGRTQGRSWEIGFFGYKSAHASARQRSRGRSRPEYVNYELTDGTAVELANLLKDEADSLNFSEFESIEFVIDFVQALPYVPDDVSRGFDDYTKFIMETVPEMGGDCEDTAIMLASILEAEPFNYDMILIQPPGHMAAGVWNSEPSGYYWELDGRKYEYIETTGRGWGMGDCPEEYRSVEAYLHQV